MDATPTSDASTLRSGVSDAASRSHTSPLVKPTATVASNAAKAAILAGARHSPASDVQKRLTAAASQATTAPSSNTATPTALLTRAFGNTSMAQSSVDQRLRLPSTKPATK